MQYLQVGSVTKLRLCINIPQVMPNLYFICSYNRFGRRLFSRKWTFFKKITFCHLFSSSHSKYLAWMLFSTIPCDVRHCHFWSVKSVHFMVLHVYVSQRCVSCDVTALLSCDVGSRSRSSASFGRISCLSETLHRTTAVLWRHRKHSAVRSIL